MKLRPKDTLLQPRVGRTFLPGKHLRSHELCFLLHDFLLNLLQSAEQNCLFSETFRFRGDDDRREFEQSDDVFQWLESTGRMSERDAFLRRVVFPGLLSDFLHFLYVALDASRRANLAVAYALVRKPLQETLFVFETIAVDLSGFGGSLASNPLSLRSQKAGSLEVHVRRIERVVALLGDSRFDPAYLAQLRYDKNAEDSFDGICNKAVHLVTGHPAIQTEKLNLNFIFSGATAKSTQWAYLYSRLPYILVYAQLLVEYVFGRMHRTDSAFENYMRRRIAAGTLLWDAEAVDPYRNAALARFSVATRQSLEKECQEAGYPTPSAAELLQMQRDGRWPGQGLVGVRLRDAAFNVSARVSRRLWRMKRSSRGKA